MMTIIHHDFFPQHTQTDIRSAHVMTAVVSVEADIVVVIIIIIIIIMIVVGEVCMMSLHTFIGNHHHY